MKYKIGVYGSSAGDMSLAMPKAIEVGNILGEHADSVIVVTGACAGLPYATAKAAAAKGAEVWGYASSVDQKELQTEYPDDDMSIYSKLIYVPADFAFANDPKISKKYRNVISTANCDAGIIISGRWGTLNEFTNLIDFQKTAGILTSTGGIADELPDFSKRISKAGQGDVVFDDDPRVLVDKLLAKLTPHA